MYNDDVKHTIYDLNTKHGKQLLFIGVSIFIGFVILIIDWIQWFFDSLAFLFYTVTILLLILVLFSSDSTGGIYTSWFRLGSFKIQPSEFSKFTTGIWII